VSALRHRTPAKKNLRKNRNFIFVDDVRAQFDDDANFRF